MFEVTHRRSVLFDFDGGATEFHGNLFFSSGVTKAVNIEDSGAEHPNKDNIPIS
jgi:hypothetical protein